jgi:hypothetical protein
MVPEANDLPSFFLEQTVYSLVAPPVPLNLVGPIGRVAFWFSSKSRRTVPERAVDEYGDSLAWKSKVWTSLNVFGLYQPSANA